MMQINNKWSQQAAAALSNMKYKSRNRIGVGNSTAQVTRWRKVYVTSSFARAHP